MKCQYCGYNLSLDDEKCPHCGSINKLATKYVEEIKEYTKDFEKTQKVVGKKTKIGARTGRIIVIIAMILIVLIMQMIINNLADFDSRVQHTQEKNEKYIQRNQDEIASKLKELEKNRNYLGINYYVLNYQLRTNEVFDEYFRVETAAIHYTSIYTDILNIVTDNNNRGEKTNRDWCEDIARNVAEYKNYAEGEFWHDSEDSPMHVGEHGAFIKDAKNDIQDMIQVYLELSEAQASSIWDMEEKELAQFLYSKCQDIYPEGGKDD